MLPWANDSPRHRLPSPSHEGVVKHTLQHQPLTVYDRKTRVNDFARHVAKNQNGKDAFYVMNVDSVEARVRHWHRSLPAVLPFYALKCNADPVLVELLVNFHSINLHVSSVSELEQALRLVPPSRVHFYSPLLTRKTLRLICQLQPLHSLVVESEDALQIVSALSPSLPLLLRISLEPNSTQIERCFGVPIEEAFDLLMNTIQLGVNVVGISVQILSEDKCVQRLENDLSAVLKLVDSLRQTGCPITTIDIGGGFHAGKEKRHWMQRACSLLSQFYCSLPSFPRVIASPGRFFAESAFSLCTTITGKAAIEAQAITRDQKATESTGYVYIINEGIYGAFVDQFMGKRDARCRPLFKRDATEACGISPPVNSPARCLPTKTMQKVVEEAMNGDAESTNNKRSTHASAVFGAAVDPIDAPARRTRLPSMSIGDWLLWRGMGAYCCRDQVHAISVYYYTDMKHWQRLQRRIRRKSSQNSDSSSDEIHDLTECFGRMFDIDYCE